MFGTLDGVLEVLTGAWFGVLECWLELHSKYGGLYLPAFLFRLGLLTLMCINLPYIWDGALINTPELQIKHH